MFSLLEPETPKLLVEETRDILTGYDEIVPDPLGFSPLPECCFDESGTVDY